MNTAHLPGQLVVTPDHVIGMLDTEDAIHVERGRRATGRYRYYYALARDGERQHEREYWCEYCAGYYGVTHTDCEEWVGSFILPRLSTHRYFGLGASCACLVCTVTNRHAEIRA